MALIHFPPTDGGEGIFFFFFYLQLPAEVHSITLWHFCDLGEDTNDLCSAELFIFRPLSNLTLDDDDGRSKSLFPHLILSLSHAERLFF